MEEAACKRQGSVRRRERAAEAQTVNRKVEPPWLADSVYGAPRSVGCRRPMGPVVMRGAAPRSLGNHGERTRDYAHA